MSDDYLNKPISIGGSLGAPGKLDITHGTMVSKLLYRVFFSSVEIGGSVVSISKL